MTYDLQRTETFLHAVWRLSRSTAGSTFICAKDPSSGAWEHCAVPHKRLSDDSLQFLHCSAEGGCDLYFTPNSFDPAQRSPANVLPGRFLYADLDEVDPRALKLAPSLAWESSPGHYQALWILSRRLPPAALAKLGRALVYAVGADKDSWALNKVLRIPGTENHKYPDKPQVQLITGYARRVQDVNLLVSDLRRIRARGGAHPASTPQNGSVMPADAPEWVYALSAAELRRLYRDTLSRRARKLLTVRTPAEGDRSARLWEIENLCLDAGMAPEEVFVVIRNCAYNKFAGRSNETERLWTDISRAIEYRAQM